MRIYSNTRLSLPHIIHVLHKPFINPIRCDNLYIFHIDEVSQPFIHLLQENRKYYCYDNYYRNKYIEKFGNDYKNSIYTPRYIMTGNTIIIKDDKYSLSSSVGNQIPKMIPSWLKFYSPPLL